MSPPRNTAHDRSHEELLERALCGESHEGLEELLASCATCRAEWEDLTALTSELSDAGADQRADAADADRPDAIPAAPGSDRVEPLVRSLAAADGSTRSPLRILALAASVILAFFVVRAFVSDPTDIVMGDELECIAPKGGVRSFELFEWKGERADGEWFEVEVYVRGEDGSKRSLARSGRLDGNVWRPSLAERESFGARIEWQVTLRDTGGVTKRARTEASLE